MRSLSGLFVLIRSLIKNKVYLPTAAMALLASLNANTALAVPLPFLPDPAMQACLDEQAAANSWINAEDVTVFNCVGRGVQNIDGVGAFTNLRELDLSDNQILHVNRLNTLAGLTTLRLSGNSEVVFGLLLPIIEQNNGLTRLGLADIAINSASIPSFYNHTLAQPYNLIELDVANTGLQGLYGIEQYANLRILDASSNQIEAIPELTFGPFGPLSFHELNLSDNKIVDVSPLSGMTELTSLFLSGNSGIDFNRLFDILTQNHALTRLGIADITISQDWFPTLNHPITGLAYNLLELDISNTGIKGLDGIAQYIGLQILDASDNNLLDLQPLSGAPLPLRELDVSNNRIEDASQLSAFTELTRLNLSGNSGIEFNILFPILQNIHGITHLGIGDIKIDGPLPVFFSPVTTQAYNIIELDVGNTGIHDLVGIEEYTQLKVLDASNNGLESIAPLSIGHPNPLILHKLDLSANRIADITNLQIQHELTQLDLSGNSEIDFSQLSSIIQQNTGLTHLGLGDIKINGPVPVFMNVALSRPYDLVEINLRNTGLYDLSGIEQYSGLQVLNVSNNYLENISSLSLRPMPLPLTELDLSNNRVIDIAPLNNYTQLKTLNLSANRIANTLNGMQIIGQNNELTRLGMGGIAINGPLPIFINQNTGLPYKLVELDVSNAGITDLTGLEHYSSLQALNASNNDLFLIPSTVFGPNGPIHLKELDLSNSRMIDLGGLNGLTELTRLDLSGNYELDFGAFVLPVLEQNKDITQLGLADIAINGPLPILINPLTAKAYNLIELNVHNTGIDSIVGIDQYINLQVLDASNNYLDDIAPLNAGLIGPMPLHELNLSNNKIVDISSLDNFTELTHLNLSANSGIDFSILLPVIRQNAGLTHLGLGDIAINHLLPVFTNPDTLLPHKLVELDLSNTGIPDLYPIADYSNLQVLDASNNNISDIAVFSLPFAQPLPIHELDLSNNQIVDISPLNNYYGLTSLHLSGNSGISYLDAMRLINNNIGLTRIGLGSIAINAPLPLFMNQMTMQAYDLVELDISNTGIQGLLGIEQYPELQVLDASKNAIVDVNPLASLTQLSSLNLSGNSGIDFTMLSPIIAQNFNITRLGLADIAINGPFPTYVNLSLQFQVPYKLIELDLSNTGIGDVFFTFDYETLEVLNVSNNTIVDISPLASLPANPKRLRELNLSNNQIVDILALNTYNRLTHLKVSGNRGISFIDLKQVIEQNVYLAHIGMGGIAINDVFPLFADPLTLQPYKLIELDLSSTGLANLSGIDQYRTLQVLDVSSNGLIEITSLIPDRFSPLQLRELNLSNNQIVYVAPLGYMWSLKRLDLTGNNEIPCEELDFLESALEVGVVIMPASCVVGLPPTINLAQPTSNGLYFEGQTLYFSANAYDVENGDLTHAIKWHSSVSGVLGTGGAISAQLPPGDHVITASVTDLDNNSASGSVGISVTLNTAPTIHVLSPIEGQSILEGLPLSGFANAYDSEDGLLDHTVVWSSNVDGQLGTGVNVPMLLSVGTHVITATVTDAFGKTASQSVTVIVVFNNLPIVTVTNPVSGSSIIEGSTINLTGIATDVEDGVISNNISWGSDLQGALGSGATVPADLVVGVHTLSATVTDSLGKSTTQNATLTVEFNNPPTLSVTGPVSGSTIIEGESINLTAVSSDMEDGDLSNLVSWSSSLQGGLGTGSNLIADLVVGDHVLTATVIDTHGKTSSQVINLSVLFNNPPVITLAPETLGQTLEDGLSATLSATATDIESGNISSAIKWSSDISGDLGTGAQLAVTLPVGSHQIAATVSDAQGKLHSVTTQLSVTQAAKLAYCNSSGLLANRQWIESVSIAGVSNVTGSQGGYGDYWNNGAIYLNTASNQLTLQPGFHNDPDNVSWYVWVDFNRDGFFADSEMVVKTRSSATINASFDIPASAITGNTSMRISMKRRRDNDACGEFRRGEVEDYRVIIQ